MWLAEAGDAAFFFKLWRESGSRRAAPAARLARRIGGFLFIIRRKLAHCAHREAINVTFARGGR